MNSRIRDCYFFKRNNKSALRIKVGLLLNFYVSEIILKQCQYSIKTTPLNDSNMRDNEVFSDIFFCMISKVYAMIDMVAIAFRVNADSKTISFSPFFKSIISKEAISSLSNFMFANH